VSVATATRTRTQAADLAIYGLSAAFAGITAVTSTLLPHRAWGAVAFFGYAVAALAVAAQLLTRRIPSTRDRALIAGFAFVTTALLPMVLQAIQRAGGRTDRAQEEVIVIEHGGQRLLDHGTPYLANDAIAALPPGEQLLGYLPYQPGMALFGLPRALPGDVWWTDARIWFAAVTIAALGLAASLLQRGDALLRAMQLTAVIPLVPLTMATGGDDVPVLALCLLALALCAAGRYGAAGIAVGSAAALKLFAWPVVLVLLVHALTAGRRSAARLAAGAVGLPVAALLPALLVDPTAFVDNVIRFPLGEGVVTSPAQSPFPGYLISSNLPGGRAIAAALLAAAGVAIAVWLARRPPRTAAAATIVCGYGLLAAILLMPSTRFGYLLYPVAFLAWAPALRRPA
jgi:hypothetical protein